MDRPMILEWVGAGPSREAFVAGLLAFALFFAGTGDTPLIGRDEPRFAEAAREMLADGEWVVPTFGGVNRYDKPILVYWCTMASYAVFGVTERAARLPSNVAGALTVLLLAWWARRRWGPGSGLAAGLLLAVTVTFHLESRACTADLVMVLPAVVALLALERLSRGEGGAVAAAVFWTGLGVSALAKGPVGPTFAAATGLGVWAAGRAWQRWEAGVVAAVLIAGWWWLGPPVLVLPVGWALLETLADRRGRAALRRLRPWWGIPLCLAVTMPWAVAAMAATGGEFYQVGVGKHVVGRSISAMESHGGFPGFYLATGLIAAFPWFCFGPAAVRFHLRRPVVGVTERFLLAWLIAPLVILEIVETKLVHYWMLSYPAAALLIVGWLWDEHDVRRGPSVRWLIPAGAVLVGVVPLALTLHLGLADLRGWAVASLVASGAGAAAALWLWRREPRVVVAVLVVAVAVFELLLFAGYLPRLGERLVGPRAAARAVELARDDERILLYKARDDNLFFYTPLDSLNVRSPEELADRLDRGEPVLAVARSADLEAFAERYPQAPLSEVERVRGVDLGHGRWVEMSLFRPAQPRAADGDG